MRPEVIGWLDTRKWQVGVVKGLLLLPLREKAGIAYMDVGEGREQERKLEGVIKQGVSFITPHPNPLPQGERGL